MGITMQGSWTVRVKSRQAACPQRFVVRGADIGNGPHDGAPGNAAFVSGARWTLTVQQQSADGRWRDGPARLGFPVVDGGLLRFDIAAGTRTGDGGGAASAALTLTCAVPARTTDHLVYGTAQSYAGGCLLNPGRNDHVVIDPTVSVDSICRRFPRMRAVIARLYPNGRRADRTPMVLPTGLPDVAHGLCFRSAPASDPAGLQVRRVPFKSGAMAAGAGLLTDADRQAVSEFRHAGIRCGSEAVAMPGLRLRFLRYRRTALEAGGGHYEGDGRRELLGEGACDDDGRYLFRFTRDADLIGSQPGEPGDHRPDLIVQALDADDGVCFESAPYGAVGNLQRIDVWIPAAALITAEAGAL